VKLRWNIYRKNGKKIDNYAIAGFACLSLGGFLGIMGNWAWVRQTIRLLLIKLGFPTITHFFIILTLEAMAVVLGIYSLINIRKKKSLLTGRPVAIFDIIGGLAFCIPALFICLQLYR